MNNSNIAQNLNNLKNLPVTWKINSFKDVVADNSGGNTKLPKANFLEKGNIAIVDQGKDIVAGYYNDVQLRVKTEPPYVVFGDHTRVFKYIDFPFIMGADGTKVLQSINSECYTKFLYYFFLSINVPNTGYNRHFKYLKELKIPLPPLETQKKIADILDAADSYKQKTKALIDKYDQLTQSLFLDRFGDPITNPKGWEWKKLITISKQITDGTHHSPKQVKKGFPYVTAKHIKEMSLEFNSKPTFVDQEAHEEIYTRCKPEFNDVFLVKDGATTGVACLNSFNEPISLLSSVGLIKPNKQLLNSTFLVFWFNHSGVKKQLIRKFMAGAAIKRYTISKMKKFELIVPPIDLQNQFAERVQAIESQKVQAQQSLQKSEELFNSLLQQAFKGELV